MVLRFLRSFPVPHDPNTHTCQKLYTHPKICHVTEVILFRLPELSPRHYSYRKASAGNIRDADHEGYRVARNEIPTATTATITPSIKRGANGT
jgi:hypothetical protein